MGGAKEFFTAAQEDSDRRAEFSAKRLGLECAVCAVRPLAHEFDFFCEYGKCPDCYETYEKHVLLS
jgi:hypothetical protein